MGQGYKLSLVYCWKSAFILMNVKMAFLPCLKSKIYGTLPQFQVCWSSNRTQAGKKTEEKVLIKKKYSSWLLSCVNSESSPVFQAIGTTIPKFRQQWASSVTKRYPKKGYWLNEKSPWTACRDGAHEMLSDEGALTESLTISHFGVSLLY